MAKKTTESKTPTNIADLIPDNKNFNKGSQYGQRLMENSLEKFGFGRSILLDKNNRVIAGNKTLQTCADIGLENVRVIETTGDEIVAVKRTDIDLDTKKGREFALADNATGKANLAWDEEALLEASEELEISLDDWGVTFDDDLPEIEENEAKEIEEDNFDEDKELIAPRCKLGDVWQLGEHRLMCGDSTNTDDVQKLMRGEIAEMMFTDPPYGYKFQGGRRKEEKFDVLKNDDRLLDFFPIAKQFVKGFVYSCAQWKNIDAWITLFRTSFDLTNVIVWDKGGGGIGDLAHTFSSDYELILVAHQGEKIRNDRCGSVWKINRNQGKEYSHPTQKPIQLSAFAMEHSCDSGAIVLDLFGGSGSTLIACEQTERKCRMMELDPHYCDVILARWEKLTGKEAKK